MQELLLVTNAYLRSSGFSKIKSDLEYYAKKAGLRLISRTNADFIHEKPSIQKVIFWDKDIPLALRLESLGCRLYNPALSIALCDDKALTHSKTMEEIPSPKTLFLPMSYANIGHGDFEFLDDIELELSYPMILKETKGSFGMQVYLVHSRKEALKILKKHSSSNFIFQEFIKEACGKDIRVYIVGGKILGAIKRESTTGDFRANLNLGGKAKKHEISELEAKIALFAFNKMGLDFAGVDLIESKSGPLFLEINSNAHYSGFEKETGISPAKEIIALIKEDR